MPPSGTYTATVSLDEIFGAASPQSSSGSFLVTAGTTAPLGLGGGPCAPIAGILINVSDTGPTPTPPSPAVGPSGIAFAPNGEIFVVDSFDSNLYKFSAAGGAAGPPLAPIVGDPRGLTFQAGKLYVARYSLGDIAELDPSSGNVVRVVAAGLGSPYGLATDPLTGNLAVTDRSGNRALGVNPSSGAVSVYASDASFSAPQGLVFDDRGRLYVVNNGNGNVVRVDRSGIASVIGTVPGGSGVALRPGCNFSVSPTTVPPHGSFAVTVSNTLPSVEYIINYDSSSNPTIFTSTGTFTTTVSLDALFGASSPQAVNGSFLVSAGTTVSLGFTHAGICAPSEGIAVTVGSSTPLPSPPPPPGLDQGSLFATTNAGVIQLVDLNTLRSSQLASGGSRGDMMAVSPDGYLLAGQADRVVKIGPPVFQPLTPHWHFPWQYGATWYFNGGPHGWAGSSGSGLDFGPTADDRVYSAAAGRVYFIGTTPSVCGDTIPSNIVKIRHDNGWETWYVHLKEFRTDWPTGAVDIPVGAGAYLGRAGNTGVLGCGGGIHLHLELCGGLSDGPPVVHCLDNSPAYHVSWNGRVIDGWTVHSDCGSPLVPGCSATPYNGYMFFPGPPDQYALPCGASTCTRVQVGPSTNPTSTLTESAPAGTSILKLRDISIYSLAERIRINPGGTNQEDRTITGFGSLILDSPLQFDHGTGEPIAILPSTPVSVGGIAEQPDIAALPSNATGVSDAMMYALGGTVMAALVLLTAGGWVMSRRRRAS